MMQSTHSCLVRHYETFLQTVVFLMVLFPTSKEWALAPQVQWRRNSRPSSRKECSYEASPDLKTVSCHSKKLVATIKIASVEQVVDSLAARFAALEAGAVSASSVSGSAGSAQMMKTHEAPYCYGFLADNATQACPHGLKRHSLQPIRQKESTAKQELHQLDSYSKPEPDVKSLWHDIKMMASYIRSTVLFAKPRAQFLLVNPGHQNTERSDDGLHRCGRSWLRSYKEFSLERTPIPHTLFRPLISVPEYSTYLIACMELQCQFSSLPQLDTHSCITSFSGIGTGSRIPGLLMLTSSFRFLALCTRRPFRRSYRGGITCHVSGPGPTLSLLIRVYVETLSQGALSDSLRLWFFGRIINSEQAVSTLLVVRRLLMKIFRGEDDGKINTVGTERFLCQHRCASQLVQKANELHGPFGQTRTTGCATLDLNFRTKRSASCHH